jgi:hypothetical protein
MPTYTDKPKNRLDRATGMDDQIFNLKNFHGMNKPYNPGEKKLTAKLRKTTIGFLFDQAYQNPYRTQRRYHEENGFEFEERATWFPVSGIMVANTSVCPASSEHHLGSTCGICDQHG